jgi:predicted nuclease of predicted toxin-antitoxin system
MQDGDILSLAVEQKAMVITMDKDFGELVYNSGLEHSGVLLLRLDAAAGGEKAQVVE